MNLLRTPEEVAKDLHGLTPYEIRQLVRRREIEYVRASRGKVLFTDEQIEALVRYLTQHPRQPVEPLPEEENPFRNTARSKALHRRVS